MDIGLGTYMFEGKMNKKATGEMVTAIPGESLTKRVVDHIINSIRNFVIKDSRIVVNDNGSSLGSFDIDSDGQKYRIKILVSEINENDNKTPVQTDDTIIHPIQDNLAIKAKEIFKNFIRDTGGNRHKKLINDVSAFLDEENNSDHAKELAEAIIGQTLFELESYTSDVKLRGSVPRSVVRNYLHEAKKLINPGDVMDRINGILKHEDDTVDSSSGLKKASISVLSDYYIKLRNKSGVSNGPEISAKNSNKTRK